MMMSCVGVRDWLCVGISGIRMRYGGRISRWGRCWRCSFGRWRLREGGAWSGWLFICESYMVDGFFGYLERFDLCF